MKWNEINRHRISYLERLCGEYHVVAPKVPDGGNFRGKVYDRGDGHFSADANVLEDARRFS
jgi:hypothetical protein